MSPGHCGRIRKNQRSTAATVRDLTSTRGRSAESGASSPRDGARVSQQDSVHGRIIYAALSAGQSSIDVSPPGSAGCAAGHPATDVMIKISLRSGEADHRFRTASHRASSRFACDLLAVVA
jgi:hypothetical protein